MTDSGSFDQGDVVTLADLDALNNLVNAKCAACGVAGSGCASGWFAANKFVNRASDWQAIVAAYQRAWDASFNKPGTRQGQPSQGGDFKGELFQNMWTQLNQLTFIQSWADWDESSEALLASPSTYVAMFENPTTGGNEVGQGCGLNTADATLACFNSSVEGATGTPPRRYAPGINMVPTINLVNGIFRSGPWSIIFKLQFGALSGATDNPGMMSIATADDNYRAQLWISQNKVVLYPKYAGVSGVSSQTSSTLSNGVVYYIAMWYDGVNNIRGGFSTSKPTSWASFPSGQRTEATVGGNYSGITLGGNYNAFFSCVNYLGGANSITAYYIVCSKGVSLITT